MSRVKRNRFAVSVAALVIAALIGAFIAAVQVLATNIEKTYAYSDITLLYEGASKGLAPNGSSFAFDVITSEDLIQDALDALGMSSSYKASDIKKCLFVTGNYPKGVVSEITKYVSKMNLSSTKELTADNYFPTEYHVTLYNDFDTKIAASDLKAILQQILDQYYRYYFVNYSAAFEQSGYSSLFPSEDLDYYQQLAILSMKVDEIKSNAKYYNSLHPNFTCDGYGFADIITRCNNLTNVDISNADSSVSINSLSKNRSRLEDNYSLIIRNNSYSLAEQQANLEAVNSLIDAYEKDMILYVSTGDEIVKVGESQTETYDKLVAERVAITEEISSLNSIISDYTQRVEELRQAAEGGASYSTNASKLEASIQNIETLVGKLSQDYGKILSAYTDMYVNESGISVEPAHVSNPSLFSMAFVMQFIKCAGPLCMLVLMVILVISFRRENRAWKKTRR